MQEKYTIITAIKLPTIPPVVFIALQNPNEAPNFLLSLRSAIRASLGEACIPLPKRSAISVRKTVKKELVIAKIGFTVIAIEQPINKSNFRLYK